MDDNIGYIKISRFAKTTYEEFLQAAKTLSDQGMEKLIIDLRGNGGGFLDAAVNIADELLPKGKMIVYTQGRARERQNYLSKKNGIYQDIPLSILIDQSSASASEILAGAVQDNDRGDILGRRSFGKGLVQEQTNWPDGSATRLTIARYYTPTGRCIQRPYEEGTDEYLEDFQHRYESGEVYNADSVSLPDSLKFETPEGKIVYGGGGIMPDHFVPIDTAGGSIFLNQVVYKGLVYDYAFDYVDARRDEMESQYSSSQQFAENCDEEKLLADFIAFSQSKGIVATPKDLARSKSRLIRRLKAYIARNVWNNEGFYRILNEDDEVVREAKSTFVSKISA
jgi:carboxyl-terminal processing protease